MLNSCTVCGHLPPKPAPCKLANGRPCGPCHELESFDKEAQAILERLTEKRRSILENINERHDPFIHHLPIELISQIFISCLPERALDQDACRISLLWDPLDCRYIQPFNIVLGAISRAWRRIAWSTPGLWSILPIRLHRFDSQAYKDLVLEWFRRSGHTPLDVAIAYGMNFCIPPTLTEENLDLWRPLIDIANGCSSRWRTIKIKAPQRMLRYITGDGEDTCVPQSLEVFSISEGPWRSADPFSLTNSKPAPSQLVLRAMPLRSIDIDWSNLTTVKFASFRVNEWMALLHWSPRLTTCEVRDLSPGEEEGLPPARPIHHYGIRDLNVSWEDKEAAEQFLCLLTLPSLVSLSCDSVPNSVADISKFLERSACNLETLSFWSDEVGKILALAPHLRALKRLEYSGSFHVDPFRNLYDFLPNLRELSISNRYPSWNHLIDFYLLRALKTLSVRVNSGCDPRDERLWVDEHSAHRLQDLVKNGHNIKITCRFYDEKEDRDFLAWSVQARMSKSTKANY